MSTMNWKEPETKAKFLLAILSTQEENALSGAKAPKIAEYMGCTAKAVTHQLTALRKELAEFKTKDGQVAATPAPKKRKAKSSDDGEDVETPVKKTKATPKKKTTTRTKKVKEPEVQSDEDAEDDVATRKDRAEGKDAEENGEENEDDGDVREESE